MNWIQQNHWLGRFLIVFAIATLLSVIFFISAKRSFNEAWGRFNETAAEKSRLERGNPFPNEANYREMEGHLENYGAALDQLKEDLKARSPSPPALAPNEFQSRLRQAMLATSEKMRAAKVKLPDKFALGFEQFTAGLPEKDAAPLLGQQLSQMELLMNILIDARVNGVIALARVSPSPETTAATASGATRKPAGAAGSKMLERSSVDITFASTAGAARKVLNQIASSDRQFYIVRTLHVRNEKDKGPPREGSTAVATSGAAPKAASNAITFIVGNEHIETSARIELVRFTF